MEILTWGSQELRTEKDFPRFLKFMKRISCILSILALLVAFSHNVSATRQAQDIIIIDKVYDSWKMDHKTALRAIKDKCYREISLEVYGNDHDIIGNREIVKYLIKTEK